MLLFSTILSVTDKLTHESFISLVLDWNKSRYLERSTPGCVAGKGKAIAR